ncbi:hypothetical protein AURDEDRAFT_124631 [Auricularia subglabra TFB-10046 SS5]|nr:hypothetical protein AURDEDRAFT_124631 [Auricularia subglabra TFB-10046 SS5]
MAAAFWLDFPSPSRSTQPSCATGCRSRTPWRSDPQARRVNLVELSGATYETTAQVFGHRICAIFLRVMKVLIVAIGPSRQNGAYFLEAAVFNRHLTVVKLAVTPGFRGPAKMVQVRIVSSTTDTHLHLHAIANGGTAEEDVRYAGGGDAPGQEPRGGKPRGVENVQRDGH